MKTTSWLIPVLALFTGTERTIEHPAQGGRPECPHHWDFKSGQIPLVQNTIDVPELHDCQRFIVPKWDSLVYDSLYAIFASDSLAWADTALALAPAGRSWIPVAVVFADGGRYPPLGILSRYSCLYLSRDPAFPGRRRARMVPVTVGSQYATVSEAGLVKVNCGPTENPRGTTLEVRVLRDRGARESDYPAVARWDWDATNKKQFIGIKCGAAWCEVGDMNFVSSTPAWHTDYADRFSARQSKVRRTRVVKGWYDQQMLAMLDSGTLKPSPFRGTIYPDSVLDDLDREVDFPAGSWVTVAHVALEVPSLPPASWPATTPYKKSLNLDLTPPDSPLNRIVLCRGTSTVCAIPTSVQTALKCDDGQWWVRVEDTNPTDGEGAFYTCVTRRPHNSVGFTIPGTARWRWLASDETIWDRCAQGCCEVEPPCTDC